MNDFPSAASLRLLGISDDKGVQHVVQQDECKSQTQTQTHKSPTTATVQIAGSHSVSAPHKNQINTTVQVETLASALSKEVRAILILNVALAVNGSEHRVLRGALPLFQQHRIHNAFVHCDMATWADTAQVLTHISSHGYAMWIVHESSESQSQAVSGNHTETGDKKPVLLKTSQSVKQYAPVLPLDQNGTHLHVWLFLLNNPQRAKGASPETFWA
jgi:hypothetical protein